MADGPDDELADTIAYVCGDAAGIREALEPATEPLDRLLEAVRAGEDITAALNDLHVALQAAGDALGVYGYNRSPSSGLRLAGAVPSRPREALLICPTGRCSRYDRPDPVAPAPTCAIDGLALRRTLL
ncbi:hypothetical protein ACFV4F_37570 [Kitasatospora sp. NPDC059722]|uniref:hypothetical protein n=1 Tax=Kitasatospora sp. NPDC059722 TaxID=3346925 RepID=UPI00368728DF